MARGLFAAAVSDRRIIEDGWNERTDNGGRAVFHAAKSETGRQSDINCCRPDIEKDQETFLLAGRDVHAGGHSDICGADSGFCNQYISVAGADAKRGFASAEFHGANVSDRYAGDYPAGKDGSGTKGGTPPNETGTFCPCRDHVLWRGISDQHHREYHYHFHRAFERRRCAESAGQCDGLCQPVDDCADYGDLRACYRGICLPQADCGKGNPIWRGNGRSPVRIYVWPVSRQFESVCLCFCAGSISGLSLCKDRQSENYHCHSYDDQLYGRAGDLCAGQMGFAGRVPGDSRSGGYGRSVCLCQRESGGYTGIRRVFPVCFRMHYNRGGSVYCFSCKKKVHFCPGAGSNSERGESPYRIFEPGHGLL